MRWPPEDRIGPAKLNLELFDKGLKEAIEWKRAKGEKKSLRIMDSCEFVNRRSTEYEIEVRNRTTILKCLNGIIYNCPKKGSWYTTWTTQIEAMTCDKRTGITLVETANTIYLVSEHGWIPGGKPPDSEIDFVDEGLFEGLLGFARDCAFPRRGEIRDLPVRFCAAPGGYPKCSSSYDREGQAVRPCSICGTYCCVNHRIICAKCGQIYCKSERITREEFTDWRNDPDKGLVPFRDSRRDSEVVGCGKGGNLYTKPGPPGLGGVGWDCDDCYY